MKRKLSPIYYIIPVLYIGVILFFVFMQFQAREEFGEKVGSLSVSGVYAKTLGGGQRMRHIEVRFHDLQMDFSQVSSAIVGFGSLREKKLPLESFSQFPDGFEIVFSDGTALRFVVEGSLGDRVVISPIIPQHLEGLRTLSLPFTVLEGAGVAVKGIPLLSHKGPAGIVYVSLGSGSRIDTEKQRFVLQMESDSAENSIVFERLLEEQEPYLYWFSRNFTLIDQEEFDKKIESYLGRSYQYWNSVFISDPSGQELIGDLGISLISESIKRGAYRRTLALISRNLRQLLRDNADNPSLYNSASYLGNLPSFLSARQQSATDEIDRVTDLIKRVEFSVFKTPNLLRFILNHAPFSLAEEVLRLADSVQLETTEVDTLIYLVNLYLEAVEYLDIGEASLARISDIIDRFILPAIKKTSQGFFFSGSSPTQASEANLYESILIGNALMRAGEALAKDSYISLGRTFIYTVLDLADTEGFVPTRVRIQDGEAEPAADLLSPESIYRLVPSEQYTPAEYPLYSYLYPGSWIWTASRLTDVKIDDQQYRFFFSFPTGETHYLLIQGIRQMTSMIMHGIPWKSDPEYFRYTDGWVYDENTQTLFVKLTHRTISEELVLNY
jgi:hypothetical protein